MRGSAPVQLCVSATIIVCNSCVVKHLWSFVQQLWKYVQQLCADGPAGRCPCSTGRGGRKVAPAANVSRCQSARPAIRTSTNMDAKRHKMQPQIHNQQHNNFSSLFFLSDTTSLEINCHKPNFWWISMMRERKKSLLVSKQRVDL